MLCDERDEVVLLHSLIITGTCIQSNGQSNYRVEILIKYKPLGSVRPMLTKIIPVCFLSLSKVAIMDDSLQSLTKLQALILAGNCLSNVPGYYLPRELLLLELYCNRLQDLSHLLEDCPPNLLYLGLARNYLTKGKNTAGKN